MKHRMWFDHGLGDCVHFAAAIMAYKRRGHDIAVHFEGNKRFVWDACGIEYSDLDGATYHQFGYFGDFNQPVPEYDWSGSKLFSNLPQTLPQLNEPSEALWEDICSYDYSNLLYANISQSVQDEVDRLLNHLPRPITLLHSHGTNFPTLKNLTNEDVRIFYDRFLAETDGSLVLIDWDRRVPEVSSGRVRHLARDMGHLSVEHLAALMRRASLLIGVDSGPYHLSLLTPIPAIGVFHHHYPSCVTLPRPQSVVMTRNADTYRPVNRARRSRWSVVEYPGVYPGGDEIWKHTRRMLAGCRYLADDAKIGRDVMIQQWVWDFLATGPTCGVSSARSRTTDAVLRALKDFDHPEIVETGCSRGVDDWGAGCFTYVASAVLHGLGRGCLTSVDISAHNLQLAADICLPWSPHVQTVQSDSVDYLQARTQPIDVLYLDSLDTEHPAHAKHCLQEAQVAQRLLHERSLICIDDTSFSGKWSGKGSLAISWLCANGWRLDHAGYQVVMRRKA